MLVFLYMFALFGFSFSEIARYDNYRVYKITPQTVEHLQILNEIESTSDSYKFLQISNSINSESEIIVPPHKFADFHNLLEIQNIQYRLIDQNLQKSIDEEQSSQNKFRSTSFDWKSYHSLDEINEWMDTIVKSYPNQTSLIVVGKSYEGREIRGVKVSYKAGNTGIFVEGGIHAREWISPATVTYILNELLKSEDQNVQNIAENFDWYIVPVTNPDGYHYTFTKDRFWRKTRKPYYVFCFGADPNRNWDNHWGEEGTSHFPCSDVYGGPNAFSEIETKSLSDYISTLEGKLTTYLSFHAYSQLLLFPYGYTKEHAHNHNDLQAIGNKTIESLAKRYGTQYEAGNIYETIYPVSGSSLEWVYDNVQTQIAFTYELRPRGNSGYGFILPAEEIIPTGEETLDSIVTMLQEAKQLGYYDE